MISISIAFVDIKNFYGQSDQMKVTAESNKELENSIRFIINFMKLKSFLQQWIHISFSFLKRFRALNYRRLYVARVIINNTQAIADFCPLLFPYFKAAG